MAKLRINALNLFQQRIDARAQTVENTMNRRWMSASVSLLELEDILSAAAQKQQISLASFSAAQAETLLKDTPEVLFSVLRKNSVNGVFVILDGEGGKDGEKACLYIRDASPESNPGSHTGLLLECAPPDFAQMLHIPFNTNWTAKLQLKEKESRSSFFFSPYRAAERYAGLESADLGYWGMPFALREGEGESITYSVPLRDENGTVFGVAGVEISVRSISKAMLFNEITGEDKGAYLLARTFDGNAYEIIAAGSAIYDTYYPGKTTVYASPNTKRENVFELEKGEAAEQKLYAAARPIHLYRTHTPFEAKQWVIVGMVEEDGLFGFMHSVTYSVLVIFFVCLLLGMVGVAFAGRMVVRPILSLTEQMRSTDPELRLRFKKTKITEIDELISVTEELGRRVADSASRLSQLIDLAGIPVGAFEYQKESKTLSFTGRFFELLNVDFCDYAEGDHIVKAFGDMMQSLSSCVEERSADRTEMVLYRCRPDKTDSWVRMKIVETETQTLGVLSDITRETVERRKIERERDYDPMTDLLNRRAFRERIQRLFEDPARLGIAALVMFDLDNLKYLNDTYGHETGDDYILCVAGVLKCHTPQNALISRMSGDEFHAFFYGASEEEELRTLIGELRSGILQSSFLLPDKRSFHVRVSAGFAFYPRDTADLDLLYTYADYAMYQIKNTIKGEFNEFRYESYQREAALLENRGELSRLLEGQLVEYAFQPIVRVTDGAVIGYEALMRPALQVLQTPSEVLKLARAQSALYEVERLTWFKALDAFSKLPQGPAPYRLFVNSIASEALSQEDISDLELRFGTYLRDVVTELSEQEWQQADMTGRKRKAAAQWGAVLAVDAFGAGRNHDKILWAIEPSFVKIDRSIVRGIDGDTGRQTLLDDLLRRAKGAGAQCVAVGVESIAELEVLVRAGVDYIQGHLTGRPNEMLCTPDEEICQLLRTLSGKYRSSGE